MTITLTMLGALEVVRTASLTAPYKLSILHYITLHYHSEAWARFPIHLP